MLNPDTGLEQDPDLRTTWPGEDLLTLDPLAAAAAVAFGHIVDEVATVEDLEAYRAWIVSLRLDGWAEHDVATSVDVANHLARKLGLA